MAAESRSFQTTKGNSFVYGEQAPFLKDIYSRGQGLADQQANFGQTVQNISDPLFQQSSNALSSAANIPNIGSDIAQGTSVGQQTLADLQQGGINPHLQGMVDNASFQINNNLQRNILPSVRSGGNAANPYGGGGSRQGIAEGIALSDANQQLSNTVSQLYGQAYDADQGRRLSSANAYTGSALAGRDQSLNFANNLTSAGSNLLNLGLSPQTQAWTPLQNYANLINSPVVLNKTRGTSTSTSFGPG